MSRLPEGWRLVSLADSTAICTSGFWGLDDPALDTTPARVIRNGDVGKATRIATDLPVRHFSEKQLGKAGVRAGDVILVTSGAYTGNVARIRPSDAATPTIASNFVRLLRGGEGVDGEFLGHALAANSAQEQLATFKGGSAIPNLQVAAYDGVRLCIPPLAEQRKIAAILSSVDETIEKIEAVIVQLDVVKKAMLEELLTRGIPGRHSRFKQTEIGEVPETWMIRPLGELVDFINGRAFSERDWKKTGVPIIRIQNLNGGTEFNYFQGEVEDRFAVRPNDLLFSWSGTRGTSFGPHVWRGPAGVLNQHIFNVKNLRGVTQGYLLWALRFITTRIEKAAHGGSGIVHITKGALEQFRVPVPDASEQAEIADRLQAIDQARRATVQELTARQNLKSSLAEALLSGRLRTKGESAA